MPLFAASMLEPGEIIFCNNFSVLHARTEFRNSAEKTRLLARLWLNTPGGRPVVPELLERSLRSIMSQQPGDQRLNLSSIQPRGFTRELLRLFEPVQSNLALMFGRQSLGAF